MIYYVSGVPCSDELYHHGILGQKWGVRRYQNEDGSYTTLGKIHYGVQKTGKAIGKGAKTVGKGVAAGAKAVGKYGIKKVKQKHPSLMTDQELDEAIIRAKKLETLSSTKEMTRGRTAVGKMEKILTKGTDTLVSETAKSAGQELGKKVVKRLLMSSDERETEAMKRETALLEARQGLATARDAYQNYLRDQQKEREKRERERAQEREQQLEEEQRAKQEEREQRERQEQQEREERQAELSRLWEENQQRESRRREEYDRLRVEREERERREQQERQKALEREQRERQKAQEKREAQQIREIQRQANSQRTRLVNAARKGQISSKERAAGLSEITRMAKYNEIKQRAINMGKWTLVRNMSQYEPTSREGEAALRKMGWIT